MKLILPPPPPRDRRLWTWEVRVGDGPTVTDIAAVSMSPEGGKKVVNALRDSGYPVPGSLRILPGSISSEGSHFHEPQVRTMLAGGS